MLHFSRLSWSVTPEVSLLLFTLSYLRKGEKWFITTLRNNWGYQRHVGRSGSRDSPAAHGADHSKAGYLLYSQQRTTDTHTSSHGGLHDGTGYCRVKKAETLGESMVEQSFWQELQPMENLCWSNPFLKDCTLPTLEKFKELQPVGRNHAGAGRKEQQRLPWTEQNLHSLSPCTPCSEGGRRDKIEVEPGKRSCIFSFVFFSHYLNLLVINNETALPQVKMFCLWWQLLSDLSILISTHKIFHLILSPSYAEYGVWESSLLGTC